MARKTVPLSDVEVKNAKAEGKQKTLFDGGGLYLLVKPNGEKGWRFKFRLHGKERLMSFGTYPAVSLAKARDRRSWAKGLIADGIDPLQVRQKEQAEQKRQHENTFNALAEEWLSKQNLADSTVKMIRSRLEKDIYPKIGKTPISELTPKIILDSVLRPMEARGAVVLSRRVKSIVSQVFCYGIAEGVAERDITADLKGALKKVEEKHRAAITEPEKVGALLRAIDAFEGTAVVKAAMQLHPLTAVRPGELRGAEWSEFDFEQALWIIPKERMKMKVDHIVPLSQQAVEILQKLYPLTGDGKLVFPSIRTRLKPISNVTMNAALRRIGFTAEEVSPHGWRATFRTMADERLREPIVLIEMQLSHRVRDVHGKAYNRTAFLEERRELMQRWASYLDLLREGKSNKVVPFRKAEG